MLFEPVTVLFIVEIEDIFSMRNKMRRRDHFSYLILNRIYKNQFINKFPQKVLCSFLGFIQFVAVTFEYFHRNEGCTLRLSKLSEHDKEAEGGHTQGR